MFLDGPHRSDDLKPADFNATIDASTPAVVKADRTLANKYLAHLTWARADDYAFRYPIGRLFDSMNERMNEFALQVEHEPWSKDVLQVRRWLAAAQPSSGTPA